jgi:hypothetical protein
MYATDCLLLLYIAEVLTIMTLTVEQFQQALPDKVKKSVNQQLIDQINKTLSEPELYEAYRDNLMSYTRVMADGRFKVENYVDAVKYVSHKLMGCSNIDAYTRTFPDKYQNFVNTGVSRITRVSW